MMRLIDADALGRYLNDCNYAENAKVGREREFETMSRVLRCIENAPTVDICEACNADVYGAVEVVRCEDCRWYDKSTTSGTYEPIAYKCRLHQRFTLGNMFCSDGEKNDA